MRIRTILNIANPLVSPLQSTTCFASVSNLAKGIYFLRVKTEKTTEIRKVVIE